MVWNDSEYFGLPREKFIGYCCSPGWRIEDQ